MGLSVHDPFVDPLGNPLGLARNSSQPPNPRTIYLPGSGVSLEGTYEIPGMTSFARFTVIGGGAGNAGSGNAGGGGGGLARSAVMPVTKGQSLSYTAGNWGVRGQSGGTSSLSFGSLLMSATGGRSAGSGGIGSGGEINTQGGAAIVGGGGCGGITTDGGNGGGNATSAVIYAGDGGGGGGGSSGFGGGGGGFGQPGGDGGISSTAANAGGPARDRRQGPTRGFTVPEYVNGANQGGEFGGGGGGGGSITNPLSGRGGCGGIIIELW